MTLEQIKIVKKSWRKLMMIDPDLVADLFYTKLFNDYPRIRPLFPKDMSTQNKKLTEMLTMIVTCIDHPDAMRKDVINMAQRHTSYYVKPEHYNMVGQSLLWTLEQGIGTEWNSEVKDAWTIVYHTVTEMMLYCQQNS